MALPQMVGVVQEAFRRQQERPVDPQQRLHNDIPAAEYPALHRIRLLRNILTQHTGVDLHKQLRDILHHQPPGHPIRLLGKKNLREAPRN